MLHNHCFWRGRPFLVVEVRIEKEEGRKQGRKEARKKEGGRKKEVKDYCGIRR